MAANSRDGRANARLLSSAAAALGGAIVIALAIRRVDRIPYTLSWTAALRGIWPMLPVTVPAAIRVWGFWGWSAAVVAGLLLKADPELGLCDSALGGATGVWVGAFLLGNLVGPVGLFRAPLAWALPAVGTLWLLRYPPAIRISPPTAGQWFALLAIALLAASILPLQLGSPMVPYLDALSWPASAQRIVSFHVYQPFNNDPYGFWAPFSQEPALEMFYAMLALGSRTRLAVLAETAAMLPMCALLVFSVYRLGRTFFGDVVGGFAAILLFLTPLFGYAQGMRGTALVFVLVGVGLGFFLDSRHSRVRMALGALLIGTSVAVQAPIGAFAIVLAGAGIILWLATGDVSSFVAGGLCLVGAVLFGAPEIPVGLNRSIPWVILPLCQLAGVALILIGAMRRDAKAFQNVRVIRVAGLILTSALILALILAVVMLKPIDPDVWNDPLRSSTLLLSDTSLHSILAPYRSLFDNLPLLTVVALEGLIIMLRGIWIGTEAGLNAALPAFALLLCVPIRIIQVLLAGHVNPVQEVMLWNFSHKLAVYWCPYFLAVIAAVPFAAIYNFRYQRLAVFGVLLLVFYPWSIPTTGKSIWTDDREHSIVERWAVNLDTAANGYYSSFAGSPWYADGRWASSPADWALFEVLEREKSAGRITANTHILHVADGPKDFVRLAVFTGIYDDPIEYSYDPNDPFYWGGRIGGVKEMESRLADKPPYILFQTPAPAGMNLSPEGYDEIFRNGDLRLFRRHSPGDNPRPG
ncbi:MAG: hypothetical protein WAU82_21290 [Candidatus Binatus sp.]|uniref:hypothetical protein n=1 Tax=Candidatus Binatus sp. TaxID=2811406 RepID=UPI003BB05796